MVYLDTNILIYLLEGVPEYALLVSDRLEFQKQSGRKFYTSTLLISEFFAGTNGSIENLRSVSGLSFHPANELIAIRSGTLQRKHNIKIGDSIHLATAIELGCEIFFTNDKGLAAVASKYLQVELLSEYRVKP